MFSPLGIIRECKIQGKAVPADTCNYDEKSLKEGMHGRIHLVLIIKIRQVTRGKTSKNKS